MKRLNTVLFLALFCLACSKEDLTQKSDNIFYQKAYKFRDDGKSDSAFFYFDRARDQFLQAKDSLKAANCMVNMAIISTDVGDLFGGQELALQAIPYFNENNSGHHPYLLSNYNNLGITSNRLRKYEQAIDFYTRSLDFVADSSYALVVRNNIANATRKKGDLVGALEIYRSILKEKQKPVNYARVLSNLAYTQWLQNPTYIAADELHKALQVRLQEKDLWGEHASYAQLADYYMKLRPDSALVYAKKMFRMAEQLHSADDRLEALQKLIALSSAPESKQYFNTYRHLEDSIQTARDNAKNQFALIRYETEKHKADKLVLQQKNTVRNIGIISLLIILIVGAGFFTFWHRRRTRRLALEAQNALQAAHLKTSKKIHDVVANGIYRIMSEMEHQPDANQEKILDQLEVLYERSRDISYEDGSGTEEHQSFPETVSKLLLSFQRTDRQVLIFGNKDEVWQSVSPVKKTELQHVLQELLVNMSKHSQASSVAVRFEQKAGDLWVYYTDNGVGIAQNTPFKNGLSSTGNRIDSIGGNITFGAGTTGGLNIQIQIPGDH